MRLAHEKQYVYVIQQGKNGPVKIGVAYDPEQRLREHQVSNPEQLYLLAYFNGGTSVERDLHKRCAQWHIRGEWFEPTKEVAAIVKAVRAERGCEPLPDPEPSVPADIRACSVCGIPLNIGTSKDWIFGKHCDVCADVWGDDVAA